MYRSTTSSRRSFQRYYLLGALLALTTSPSLAQDRWSGFHVGAHVGVANVETDGVFDSSSIARPNDFEDATLLEQLSSYGAIGGLLIGSNIQKGNLVYGVEADWSYYGRSASAFDAEDETSFDSFFNNGFQETGDITDGASATLDWIATIRGKAGLASANSLLFATAGLAYAKGKFTARNNDFDIFTPDFSDQGTTSVGQLGVVVGLGIEHAFSQRFSIRGEALYHHFGGDENTSALTSDSSQGDFFKFEDVITARIAAVYRPFADKTGYQELPIAPADWSGLTIGGHGGFSRVDFDSVFDSSEIDNPFDLEDSVIGKQFDLDGFSGGGHLGYDHAFSRYVLGVEADWTYLGKEDRAFDPNIGPAGTNFDDAAEINLNWLASLRARAGVLSGQTLFYGTAGVAYASGEYAAASDDTSFATANRTDLSGFGAVIGGGIEHQIGKKVRLRLEALNYQLDLKEDTSGLTADSDAGDFASLKSVTTIRAGVTFKLGG